MRIMSLDVGSRTIGIACSDALLMTAQGIETIRRTSLEKDFNRLQELITEYEVHELVVGMPKNMNGTKGERAEKTEEFVEKMKEVIDLPVTYWDERLSTVMAERQLIAADVSRKKRKSVIDKIAFGLLPPYYEPEQFQILLIYGYFELWPGFCRNHQKTFFFPINCGFPFPTA